MAALHELLGLRYAADLRTLFFVFVFFPVFLFAYCRWDRLFSSVYSVLFFLALCLLSFQGAVSTHNAIHCPPFRSLLLTKLFQIVLSLVYGHPVSAYVPGHNLSHHKYTNQRKDIMRTKKLKYSINFLNGLFFFFHVVISGLKNDSNYFAMQQKLKRPIFYQLRREQIVLYSCALVLATYDFWPWFIFAFWPQMFGKWAIISLNFIQHDGCDMTSKYNFARNFTGSVLNYLCFNNGYHTIHHVHPGLHWSETYEKHKALVEPFIAKSLDQESMGEYCFRAFIYPGKRLDYLGKPVEFVEEDFLPDEPWSYGQEETYSTGEKLE